MSWYMQSGKFYKAALVLHVNKLISSKFPTVMEDQALKVKYDSTYLVLADTAYHDLVTIPEAVPCRVLGKSS